MPRATDAALEQFAQALAKGLSAGSAYREVFGDAPGARTQGPVWAKRKDVQERVSILRDAASKVAEKSTIMTRIEVLQIMTNISRGELTKDKDRIAAAKLLAEMEGMLDRSQSTTVNVMNVMSPDREKDLRERLKAANLRRIERQKTLGIG